MYKFISETNPELQADLLESLLEFICVFYELRNGRPFVLSEPIGRESHYLIVCRELIKFFKLETNRLLINIPPGHGKSTMLVYFIAWAFAHYDDCQFLYVSYSKSLAEKHTAEIKAIMSMSFYSDLFGVKIAHDSKAKGNFRTTAGGSVVAFGSSGAITGQDAGLPNQNRFSGGVIIDDAHKPDEVHSDSIRQGVIENYNQTIKPRPRGDNVGIAFIGQMLHEDDLGAFLARGEDGYDWKKVKLKSIDEAGNALAPNIISLNKLRIEQRTNPYVFASQYQQDPIPAGGGIFKKDWFLTLDEQPEIISTFICCDTAETAKEYNDATVFSFFGIYQPKLHGRVMEDIYALHWIDCWEIWVEPKDLKQSFLDFWAECMRFPIKPSLVAIEKKSTGVTLASVLKEMSGLRVLEVNRTKASGSKVTRFLRAQPYIAQKLLTLPSHGRHTNKCIEHMIKITANDSHRRDDIADTVADGIQLGLIDKSIPFGALHKVNYKTVGKSLYSFDQKINYLKRRASNARR